jgi:hypothetical protein
MKKNGLKIVLIAGWIILTIAILMIALFLIENRTSHFWQRVSWTVFLFTLSWWSISIFFISAIDQKNQTARLGGIIPALSVTFLGYSFLSFITLILNIYYLSEKEIGSRLHIVIQIILVTITSLIVIFLLISHAGARSGIPPNQTKDITPKTLASLLSSYENLLPKNSITQDTRSQVKTLRETLAYSLNESDSLLGDPDYQEISIEVKQLCNSISGLQNISEKDLQKIAIVGEKAKQLQYRLKFVSEKQVRR